MNALRFCSGPGLLTLLLMLGSGLGSGLGSRLGSGLSCKWNNSIDTAQGLDLSFLERGALLDLGQTRTDLDEAECRSACCNKSACDLILFSPEEKAADRCLLVHCVIQDRDVCVLQPGNRTRVYRKTRTQKPAGQKNQQHVYPLLLGVQRPRSGPSTETRGEEERCGAEPQVGLCRAALPRWFFNKTTGSCQSFIYGGCGGNANNYDTKESCMTTCTEVSPGIQAAKKSAPHQRTGRCSGAPDPGPCRAAFPMFYYDPNTSTCQSFIYGGCHGNANRYNSMEECENQCSAEGQFSGRGKPRNHWTTALFLFLAVACVSALLLVTLIVVSLRRHRLPHCSSSLSDKEELLPEDSLSASNRT